MRFETSMLATCCVAIVSALKVNVAVSLEEGDERGRDIQMQVDSSDAGYDDEVVSGVLTIRDRNGSAANREFTMSTLELRPGGDKRVVVFHEPRDLAGFVSLSHSEILDPDQQWIFLPQLKRTRRLSVRDKTGSFAGSEFAFEDIVRWEYEKYDYRYFGSEDCGAVSDCEVIENLPRYEFSGYSKTVEWINMDILQPHRIEYYDHVGKLFKTLEFSEYRQYGRFWRPGRTTMTNLVTDAVSVIEWTDYRMGTGLSDDDFRVERISSWAR